MNSIGIIGMAVMGQNLALNVADNGYRVAVYNRSSEKTTEFITKKYHEKISAYFSISEFVQSLVKPRKILLMIKAGKPVDNQIEELIPLLEDGDIIIDGGNSNYQDTEKRYHSLLHKKIHYIGAGISGGEEGARTGPSIMPGGSTEAWEKIEGIFLKIAAKAEDGEPCCTWLSTGGAGHFVKTVHNGIEYGDMQLISEIFQIMHTCLKYDPMKISKIFAKWNEGKLNSYLIEITSHILSKKDSDGPGMLITKVLDVAEQKGTGRWTVDAGLDYGQDVSLIAQAVFQRILSSNKNIRKLVSDKYPAADRVNIKDDIELNDKLKNSLYVAKIMSYAQGFQVLKEAARINNWTYSLSKIASIWRNGCIIRSKFLDEIMTAYQSDPDLPHLILTDYFSKIIIETIDDLREIVIIAINHEIPTPGLSAALAYFDSIRSLELPTNLIQAQRDYFGAHQYRRIDRSDQYFHTNWKPY